MASEMLPVSVSHFTERWTLGKCLVGAGAQVSLSVLSGVEVWGEMPLPHYNLYLHFLILQLIKHFHMYCCHLDPTDAEMETLRGGHPKS